MPLEMLPPGETAVLLIDHQVGTMSWVGSTDRDVLKANALALAKAAKALDMPLILTSSMEDRAQGPLADEFEEIAPAEFAARVRRTGVVNAMDDLAFADAVTATQRGILIVAGVTNDVCTVYPTLTALEQGYTVYVVADAGGSTSRIADDVALRLMEQAGAVVTSTNMVLTGLARDWTSPAGQALVPVVGALVPA
ncbi:isochorismatase family protein [Streptomyces sp. AN091965]|uniref:isochorismatase family protein n=1 Tax=Streptomyces sp. AN091965 TaxID=2927803 RepID=UPI001F6238D2|nr:isochorismatase family protein [Streptomyces sp. AN091965]MCI3928202.1 isochorismatase family protein [Streptomyces sp. AN091965]